jgi:hypothetical protein
MAKVAEVEQRLGIKLTSYPVNPTYMNDFRDSDIISYNIIKGIYKGCHGHKDWKSLHRGTRIQYNHLDLSSKRYYWNKVAQVKNIKIVSVNPKYDLSLPVTFKDFRGNHTINKLKRLRELPVTSYWCSVEDRNELGFEKWKEGWTYQAIADLLQMTPKGVSYIIDCKLKAMRAKVG